MTSPAYLGLDLGTSGVRAVAVDRAGAIIAGASLPLCAPERDGSGKSVQNPELWWAAASAVLKDLSRKLQGCEPRCLAVDGTSATLLLADGRGRPLTPALMYDDTQGRSALPRIRAVAPAASAVHSASSSLAKLLLLYPTVVKREGVKALHQADWVLGRLTGRYGVSDENNALKLGYDAVARRWPGWLASFGIPPEVLPEVHPAGTTIGALTREAAAATGLPESCRVAAGTTDSTAAALAVGIAAPGDAVTSLGSTLVIKVLADRPLFDPESGVYSHRIGDAWLAGGASNSGGAVLLRYFSVAEMERLSPGLDPDAPTGLDYYPLLKPGERFPVNDPDHPPRLSPRPASDVRFFQGLLEGIAAIEKAGYRRLAELGAPYPRRVISAGGGAGNEPWRRIRARCLGVSVELAPMREAAYGAALLARRGEASV
jgi:sugar (pentulose or hexulose) kinase